MCIIGRKAVCHSGCLFVLEISRTRRPATPAGAIGAEFATQEGRGPAVKKLLLVALVALGGFFVYRQVQADRAEQDLWTEATDPVPAGAR
ncbi:hypothetical protein GCM10018781_32420 [Kitasatospora indigofera]|uniref:Uncharacterized protein n=1 Tax=Kitasatospora indigofera TaxID=67307 RepID=A0A919FRL8_9ACTN|nr:hypothetical protein GCM10018781_32420 [Kitasatospora indigofera]